MLLLERKADVVGSGWTAVWDGGSMEERTEVVGCEVTVQWGRSEWRAAEAMGEGSARRKEAERSRGWEC